MQSRITGTTMPVLEFVLEPNGSVISEAGELSWMAVPSRYHARAFRGVPHLSRSLRKVGAREDCGVIPPGRESAVH